MASEWARGTAFFLCGLAAAPAIVVVAQESAATGEAAITPERPTIEFNRWREDWSVLADPALRTEPLDDLKYMSLSSIDPKSYMSLGAGLRERFESNDAPSFGVGGQPSEQYIIERAEVDADIHPNAHWQLFVQLQDDRAFWKRTLTPVDADKLDLEQAFIAYQGSLGGGEVKVRLGRQEIGFDLQRFVSERDGPNVRQAFDAAWIDWEKSPWRLITFWSRPVQDVDVHPFDDYSNPHFQYGGLRMERQDVGPGALSAYASRYELEDSRFLFASGQERRNIADVRYTGARNGIDWDLETMGQGGTLGAKRVRAWNIGTLAGYTFVGTPGSPRIGLQMDAASGNPRSNGSTLGTFNPLFPNGYYVTLSGYTGDTNLLHLKPSITITPIRALKLMGAVGLLWRQTTADAVYVQPDIPVQETAGTGGRWTAVYGQLRADYVFNAHLTGALEVNHYAIGEALRQAGGHDSDYLGAQLDFQW
jgi:alginate export protein